LASQDFIFSQKWFKLALHKQCRVSVAGADSKEQIKRF
jgi:hypothetical protein